MKTPNEIAASWNSGTLQAVEHGLKTKSGNTQLVRWDELQVKLKRPFAWAEVRNGVLHFQEA